MIIETAITFDCFDLVRTSKNFKIRVHGIKICFQNEKEKTQISTNALKSSEIYDFEHMVQKPI